MVNSGKTLTFTIRTGVKWSDGTAFGPADVAATFNLVSSTPRRTYGDFRIVEFPATVSGDTVVLNYATAETRTSWPSLAPS